MHGAYLIVYIDHFHLNVGSWGSEFFFFSFFFFFRFFFIFLSFFFDKLISFFFEDFGVFVF